MHDACERTRSEMGRESVVLTVFLRERSGVEEKGRIIGRKMFRALIRSISERQTYLAKSTS